MALDLEELIFIPADSHSAANHPSACYPEVHPQNEDYWGHVNPIGPRACYDEGKRVAETMCYAYMKQVAQLIFSYIFIKTNRSKD
ncbi:hypothetical protein ILYODFUR_033197 [Ilyodon furcidens]|uniref:Uncharacterized protein n=1 Tax=Ilyodon furcidens TaxID=33524 RepID=A0ABV0UNX1_9TELE